MRLKESYESRYGAFGWSTVPEAGRSRVLIQAGSVGFFVDLILPAALWPAGSTQPLTELERLWYLRVAGRGCTGSRCVGLTTLPILCADCLEIPGVFTSWCPKGLFQACNGIVVLRNFLNNPYSHCIAQFSDASACYRANVCVCTA